MSSHTVPSTVSATTQSALQMLLNLLLPSGSLVMTDKAFRIHLESTDGILLYLKIEQPKVGGVPLFDAFLDPGKSSMAGAQANLVAGIATIPLANSASDKLACWQVSAGGTPGAKMSVERVDNSNVKVTSFVTGNTVQTLDTSLVKVINLGPLA